MSNERERSTRYELRFDAALDDGTSYTTGPVTNVSETGLFVETPEALLPGRTVRIVPLTASESGLFEFLGEVVRVEDGVGVGVRFVSLSKAEREKLLNFCSTESKNVAETLASGLTLTAQLNAHASLDMIDPDEVVALPLAPGAADGTASAQRAHDSLFQLAPAIAPKEPTKKFPTPAFASSPPPPVDDPVIDDRVTDEALIDKPILDESSGVQALGVDGPSQEMDVSNEAARALPPPPVEVELPSPMRGPPPTPLAPVARAPNPPAKRKRRGKQAELGIHAWVDRPLDDDLPTGLPLDEELMSPRTLLVGGLIVSFVVLAGAVALLGGRVGELEDEMWARDGALADGLGGFGDDLETLSTAQGGLTSAMASLAGSVGDLRGQADGAGLIAQPRLTASGGVVSVATELTNAGLLDADVAFHRVRLYTGRVRARGATQINLPLEKGPVRWTPLLEGAHVGNAASLDAFKDLGARSRRLLTARANDRGALTQLAPGQRTEDVLSFVVPDDATLVGVIVEVGSADEEGGTTIAKYKRVVAAQ